MAFEQGIRTDAIYVSDRVLRRDDGSIDRIRFCAEGVFLFVWASDYNLIVTVTTYDPFEEIETEIPDAKDEPTLSVVSLTS